MIKKIKNKIKDFLYKLGYKTNRNIIVFESDDWGSVRTSSKEFIDDFKQQYPSVKLDNYNLFDSIELDKDVETLQKILLSVKDSKGNPACFTINFVTENPDFLQIEKNDFKAFIGEQSSKTYAENKGSENVLSLLKQGEKEKLFDIQLHAKEHLNATSWLQNVKTTDYCKLAFKNKSIGFDNSSYRNMDTFNLTNTDIKPHEAISSACKNFETMFGKKPESFIASCYVWDSNVESALNDNNIKYIQGKRFQNIPKKSGNLKKHLLYMGKRNKHKQLYTVRNVVFEPSLNYLKNQSIDEVVNDTMLQIDKMFKLKKPVIICSHRVNYVSAIDAKNAEFGFSALKLLLENLVKKYPNIEFMASSQLSKLISQEY